MAPRLPLPLLPLLLPLLLALSFTPPPTEARFPMRHMGRQHPLHGSMKLQLLGQAGGTPELASAPAPSGYGPLSPNVPCPSDPLEYCDFYFEGYETAVPLFNLPGNGTQDVAISPAIREDMRSLSDPLGYIEVDATEQAKFLCPAPPGTNGDATNGQYGNDFYIARSGEYAAVQVRNLQNLDNATVLQSRCVLIPITSAQVYPNGSESLINLNKGDGNTQYPEDRRCVVFQTGPTPPSCGAPPPTAPPPTPECNLTCPATPQEQCDFYFAGYENQVPTFSVSAMKPDQPFTPNVQYSQNSTGSAVNVEIDATAQPGVYLNCTNEGNTDSLFYGVMYQLYSRVFQSGYGDLVGQCIKMPLTSTAIVLPGTNSPINLNTGDGNQQFPEDRRCVVFKTSA